jgi:hypothetical protein
MSLTNHAAAEALAGLNECFDEVEQVAPWRWRCVTRDDGRLPFSASFNGGFLRLVAEPHLASGMEPAIERATQLNARFAGGVKALIDPRGQQLKLCTDIVVLDRSQARDRLAWAAQSICETVDTLASDAAIGIEHQSIAKIPSSDLCASLRETSWEFAECAPDEWSVALDTESAPPAKVRIQETGILASIELARVSLPVMAPRRALALFLLTTCWMLRFVRASACDSETQQVFAFEVVLPPAPAPEELDHALASLSVAYCACAREAEVLLDKTAAGCYLALCDPSLNCQPLNRKEN